jgi:hypothetical protein
MELGKQQYLTVMAMPVKKLGNYLKWKSDLEEEKARLMKEKATSMSGLKR